MAKSHPPAPESHMPAPGRLPAPPDALERLIREHLACGPMSVARYIQLALTHPDHGYYHTRDPFGAQGDFLTAPESSQVFGELLGLWCAHVWGLLGQPSPVQLVEFGPGRGTLMMDALRACWGVARRFAAQAQIAMIETSPLLRERQQAQLANVTPPGGMPVFWHENFKTVPRGPLLVLANEFFDALPIHQLVRTEAGWCERQIIMDRDGQLAFAVAATPTPLRELLDPGVAMAPVGSLAEVAPAARGLMRDIARRIASDGGAALLIDYGYSHPATGDSLQALRRHRPHPVLENPGKADITAHVDFAALADAARLAGLRVHGPVGQGIFLQRLGLIERGSQLLAAANAQAEGLELAERLQRGLNRLAAPEQMGNLFKVMAFGPAALTHLPGFVP